MKHIDPIYVGPAAVDELVEYCRASGHDTYVVVVDENTDRALGRTVTERLRAAGLRTQPVTLDGRKVVADAHHLLDLFLELPEGEAMVIAVGSGSLTDIARFVSHRGRRAFVSVPTAASVDGFTAIGAPLVVHGMKVTYPAHPPDAVFADLPTLTAAPAELTAAGYGDMTGKHTALADWKLGRLLWNEDYSDEAAARTRRALDRCVGATQGIARGDTEAMRMLMDGLIESGLSILQFGRSHPASGSEHHFSHFLEMSAVQKGQAANLHGVNVGLGSIEMARLYERIRATGERDAHRLLETSELPSREDDEARIRAAYGPAAERVIDAHRPFLTMSRDRIERTKQTIAKEWTHILDIAEEVPPSADIERLLAVVGAPTRPEQAGLSQSDVEVARAHGHYLRNRFTVVKLFRFLGLPLK